MKLLSDNIQLKRGAWTPEEDQKLIAFIRSYGIKKWSLMAQAAGLSRSPKSCRLRWVNYLRPDLRRGRLTVEEIKTILQLHEQLGNKWSEIAACVPGRTDNEIKNFWHTYMRKMSVKNVRKRNPCKATKIKREQKSIKEAKELESLVISYGVEETCYYSESYSLDSTDSSEFYIAESYSPGKESYVTHEQVDHDLELTESSYGSLGEIYESDFYMEEFNYAQEIEEPCFAYQAQAQVQEGYYSEDQSTQEPDEDELTNYWFNMLMETN